MSNTNVKDIDFSAEEVIINFRDNTKRPPLVRKTIKELSQEGYPVDSNGDKLKLLSVKLHNDTYNISVATPDNLSVHFTDNTSQNFDGFIQEIDHTPIEAVSYHEASSRSYDDEHDDF